MKVLYLDESGEHNPAVRDPHYPIFVLGGVVVDKDYADGTLTQLFNAFKQESVREHRHRSPHGRYVP